MKRALKRVGLGLACIITLVMLVFCALLIWLTVDEYKPDAREPLTVAGSAGNRPAPGDTLRVLTLNTGYASLDATQDFFMDGGRGVRPPSSENARKNLGALTRFVGEADADIVLLQEVDRDSKRSYFTDQLESYTALPYDNSVYAANYRVPYVPFPLPTVGRVEAGLATLSRFAAASAERVALSDAYSWPLRIGQLKRCLLVERIPLENSTKELVVVNLHPEAYDDGEARARQTSELYSLLADEYAKGNYCIAGGDWNQTLPGVDPEKYPVHPDTGWIPLPVDISTLPSDWHFAFDDTSPTCRLLNKPYSGERAATQFYVIDGFLLSPNVTAEEVTTVDLDFQNTDHNPVLLEIKLEENRF